MFDDLLVLFWANTLMWKVGKIIQILLFYSANSGWEPAEGMFAENSSSTNSERLEKITYSFWLDSIRL